MVSSPNTTTELPAPGDVPALACCQGSEEGPQEALLRCPRRCQLPLPGGRPFDDERGTSPWEQGRRSSPASSLAGGGSTSRHFRKSLAFTREEFRSHETAPGLLRLRDRQPVDWEAGDRNVGGGPGTCMRGAFPELLGGTGSPSPCCHWTAHCGCSTGSQ